MSLLYKLSEFFSTLQPKDWLTLTASVAALSVSIISYQQKSNEGRLARRKQLTDLIEKLIEIDAELAISRVKPKEFPAEFGGFLNDKRSFLVRQANYLAQKLGNLISPYEYLVLAGAYDHINDLVQSERYYQKAIAASNDCFDKGIATRNFAAYLFSHSPLRLEEARSNYAKAAESFRGETDRHKCYVGTTYERWAKKEFEWDNVTEGIRLLPKAISAFEGISNPPLRLGEISRAREMIQKTLDQGAPELAHLHSVEEVISWGSASIPNIKT